MTASGQLLRVCNEYAAKVEKYETALRLITTVPKYDHIMSGDNPYWDSDVLLDGHDQCVEIARRALEN